MMFSVLAWLLIVAISLALSVVGGTVLYFFARVFDRMLQRIGFASQFNFRWRDAVLMFIAIMAMAYVFVSIPV